MTELKDYSLVPAKKLDKTDLKALTTSELLALRDQIDMLLPKTSIKDFNLEQELILQFYAVKELMSEIATDDGTPTNQKAQVMNTAKGLLADLTKLQGTIYNAEQFRLMESALAKALKSVDKVAQDAFFHNYGKAAEDMAGSRTDDAGQNPIS